MIHEYSKSTIAVAKTYHNIAAKILEEVGIPVAIYVPQLHLGCGRKC